MIGASYIFIVIIGAILQSYHITLLSGACYNVTIGAMIFVIVSIETGRKTDLILLL